MQIINFYPKIGRVSEHMLSEASIKKEDSFKHFIMFVLMVILLFIILLNTLNISYVFAVIQNLYEFSLMEFSTSFYKKIKINK